MSLKWYNMIFMLYSVMLVDFVTLARGLIFLQCIKIINFSSLNELFNKPKAFIKNIPLF